MTTVEEKYQEVKTALESEDPTALSSALSDKHAADVAEIYEMLDDEDRSRLLFALPAQKMAEVVVLLDEANRGEVVEEMHHTELSELVSEMDPDDAADVVGELTEERREDVLGGLTEAQADVIEELLAYEEDTAGGIMTKDLISMPPDASVREAIRELRSNTLDDLHYIYVVDENEKLVGVVPLRRLVLNDKHVPLGQILDPEPVTVGVNDDQEEVIHVISKYDVAAVPVIDEEGRLLGRVTHDDVVDAIEQEAEEDIYRMVGLDAAEFEKASIVRAAGIRLSWLLPCLASMGITAAVMGISQGWFDRVIIYSSLIIFVPMIGAIGGNCGIQISTVIVRGLATGDLASTRFKYAFLRESRIALVMAPACGVIAWLISAALLPALKKMHAHGDSEQLPTLAAKDVDQVAIAVGVGMTCAILVAAMLGMILPFIFRTIKVDPAIASGPIVTTVNDIISVTIFLALASLIVTL